MFWSLVRARQKCNFVEHVLSHVLGVCRPPRLGSGRGRLLVRDVGGVQRPVETSEAAACVGLRELVPG